MSDERTPADHTQDPSHDEDSRVPAQPGAVESRGTRHGMFGVSGTGDTSGYGGLVKQTVFPGASRRPYGGWYDEVADALEARLRSTGLTSAVEKVVIDRGEITPAFFGSAVTNFGVELFLNAFLRMAPSPAARPADGGWVQPEEPEFRGFIFKIQANMDPLHRDRIAFMRVVSGRFERGMAVQNPRLGRSVTIVAVQPRPAMGKVSSSRR